MHFQPVGIDRRDDGGCRTFRLVVIQHHDIGVAGDKAECLGRRCAAVDADDQARAAQHQRVQCWAVGTIAFHHAVRHVVQDLAAKLPQQGHHQRRAASAIDIVVAEYPDSLAMLHRIGEAIRGDVHVDQDGRVGQ